MALYNQEIFPFSYADIRGWQALIRTEDLCEIQRKLRLYVGCFRSVNHMPCSSAQPWCGCSLACPFCLALEVPEFVASKEAEGELY